jgi:ABC-type transport system involved in multi-copper enzyme maturation permease subunit
MIRWTMLRTLLGKEWLRLCKNVPAVMLLGLQVAVALLVATSRPRAAGPAPCLVVYWEKEPWVEHLSSRLPRNLPIRVVDQADLRHVRDEIRYPGGVHAIELRPPRAANGRATPEVWYRYSGSDPNALFPYTRWFWTTSCEYFGRTPPFVERTLPVRQRQMDVGIANLQTATVSDLLNVEMMGALLLFFVLFFTCCHMLVSVASQERERGTLLALALSPARLSELLAAKILFHLAVALVVTTLTVCVLRPRTLLEPVYWGTLVCGALGFIAIGLCVSSLARTQATAGLITLSYMLGVGLVFYLGQEYTAFEGLQRALIETYFFPLLYVSMKYPLGWILPANLIWLAVLVLAWVSLAAWLFTRRGWR